MWRNTVSGGLDLNFIVFISKVCEKQGESMEWQTLEVSCGCDYGDRMEKSVGRVFLSFNTISEEEQVGLKLLVLNILISSLS